MYSCWYNTEALAATTCWSNSCTSSPTGSSGPRGSSGWLTAGCLLWGAHTNHYMCGNEKHLNYLMKVYRISSNRHYPRIVAAATICGTRTRMQIISDDGHRASASAVCVGSKSCMSKIWWSSTLHCFALYLLGIEISSVDEAWLVKRKEQTLGIEWLEHYIASFPGTCLKKLDFSSECLHGNEARALQCSCSMLIWFNDDLFHWSQLALYHMGWEIHYMLGTPSLILIKH